MPALEVKATAARPRRPLRWWLLRGAVVAIGLVLLWHFSGEEEGNGPSGTTFAARRGPLRITVLEGGTIEALESQEIKSEVKPIWWNGRFRRNWPIRTPLRDTPMPANRLKSR